MEFVMEKECICANCREKIKETVEQVLNEKSAASAKLMESLWQAATQAKITPPQSS